MYVKKIYVGNKETLDKEISLIVKIHQILFVLPVVKSYTSLDFQDIFILCFIHHRFCVVHQINLRYHEV